MSERWRLLRSGPVPPAEAMAVDEILLQGGREPAVPILRLYRWAPHAVSLGYFQSWREFPWERFAAEGVPVVRRQTGGGAIYHGDEVTFSVAAPAAHRLFSGTVRASYDRMHTILARAMESCVPKKVDIGPRGAAAVDSDVARSPWCFHDSTEFDLVADCRKLAGSAQRRAGGRVLHHGSLLLRSNRFTPEVASVESLGGEPSFEALERALITEFERELDARFAETPLSAEERAAAAAIAESRYASEAWTKRR
jgi:lipoate-protein ligase A